MGQSAAAARRLATTQAAREVVPRDPDLSARWHRHGVPSPFSRWNHHPEYEVHLITAGTGTFVVGDHIDSFGAGQLVLVGSQVPHHWISDLAPGERLPERDVVFQFHPDWLSDCATQLPELRRLDPLLHRARGGIEFLGATREAAIHHLEEIGTSSGAGRVGHIFALLGVLADGPDTDRQIWSRVRSATSERYPEVGAADRIDLAYAYILAHLHEPDLRIVAVADHVGLSESAFSRFFSRVTGLGFAVTVRKLRLAQAGRLLRDTALPVASVAQRVGYANLSNFNRQFRLQLGCTPRAYRRQQSTG